MFMFFWCDVYPGVLVLQLVLAVGHHAGWQLHRDHVVVEVEGLKGRG